MKIEKLDDKEIYEGLPDVVEKFEEKINEIIEWINRVEKAWVGEG